MPDPNAAVPPNYDPNAAYAAAYPQPVVTPEQLAAAQQAAAAAAAANAAAPGPHVEIETPPIGNRPREVIYLISHSSLVYWWPVWLVGYILAALTQFAGVERDLTDTVRVHIYPTADLGIFWLLTIYLVVLITNVQVRGMASALVVISAILAVVVVSYFRWWDPILMWLAGLNIYLNTGAYFWFATLMFITWFISVFIIDRMTYWSIKPGQITEHVVLGASSRSFDTQNLVIEKFRADLFRHWILGLGSGDLRIETHGARQEEIYLPNVFFIGSRIGEIQNLIATRPTEFGSPTFK